MNKRDFWAAMRFSKKIIWLMFFTLIIFTITMIVTFWIKDSVPDVLIEYYFRAFGLEGFALAAITIIKNVVKIFTGEPKKEDTEENLCYENEDQPNPRMRYYNPEIEEEIIKIENPAQPEERENLND